MAAAPLPFTAPPVLLMGAAVNGKQPFVLSVIFDDVGIISIFLASGFLPTRPAAAAQARHAAWAGRGFSLFYNTVKIHVIVYTFLNIVNVQ